MPNEPRLQTKDIPLTCAETTYRDAQEATPRSVVISTMTTTTIVSSSLLTTHTGYYAIPADGDARGEPRQIKSVTGTTATVDSGWYSTASVTTIRLWQPPDIPVVGTSGGTTTTVVASGHASLTNEPDDYWNTKGYFLLGRNSTFAGSCFTESDFTSSTGTFQASATMGATPGIGAFFDLRHLVRSEGPVTSAVTQKTLSRRIVGFQQADAAVPITADGTVEFSLPVRPVTASAGDATAATPPLDIRDYLLDFCTETLDTGDTNNGASGNVLSYTDTTPAAGGFSLLNTGEVVQMLDTSTSTVGSGQMTAASVVNGSVAYASAWYTPKTTDFRTRTFDIYKGRLRRELFHGCMPTLDISITRDQLVMFLFKYSAAVALEYETSNPITSTTRPLPLLDTTIPTDGKAARFLINGVKVLCGDLKINVGLTPMPRMCLSGVNQTDGMAMDVGPTKGSFTAYADVNDTANFKAFGPRLRSRDVIQLLYQKGSSPKETFAIGMPSAQLTKSVFNYNNGQGELQCEFECQVPQLSGMAVGVPGLAFGWL